MNFVNDIFIRLVNVIFYISNINENDYNININIKYINFFKFSIYYKYINI